MSTVMHENKTCAVCGNTHPYSVIASTNAFGSSDLDLRPPEMKRSTMILWVQECPDCGYVAGSVEDETTVTREFLKRPEYLTCDGRRPDSNLAARFYKHYLISLHDEQTRTAFFAVLHAAWACDDSGDAANARAFRLLSLSLLPELIGDDPEDRDTLRLVKADVMRRAGLFSQLKEQYAAVRFGEELLDQILAFELSLAGKEDAACYTVDDAMAWDRGGGQDAPR